jgi:purine-binding chemotaxis protein CheW
MSGARENGSRQLCTFLVEELLLGIDVTRVQEVIREQAMTPVPLAPPMVHGLINLRGQIVTAIDLRCVLQLPARAAQDPRMNVIICRDEGAVSFLVDEIGDVVDVDDASFEMPPETLSANAKELIEGVYKLEEGLLLLLDTEVALQMNVRSGAEGHNHV